MECGQFCHFSFGGEQRNDPVAENLEVSLKFSDMNDPLFEKFRVLPEIPERFRLHYRLQRQEQVPGPFRSADSQKCQKILVAEPFKTRFFQIKKMDLGRVDIKCGDGALIKDDRSAKELKDLMIRIGSVYNKEVRCLISDMDTPLGMCVGNALEVAEAVELLDGKVKNNLYDLCIDIASNMVSMAKEISIIDARDEVIEAINSKKALEKFNQFVTYNGGNLDRMKISNNKLEIKSTKTGVVTAIDALIVSKVSNALGSGREKKEDTIDYEVGVFLNKQIGDFVKEGDTLCTLYYNKVSDNFNIADAYTIEEK